MEKIDNLDRQILEIISQNARIPFKDVAAECGVSRAAIHQRVQRLIDLGVIVGSGYHVNPKSLGYRTCTYVGIKLEKGSMYKTVVAELGKIPEIVECHFTTGPYTMLTKVYARDNEHLMDLQQDAGDSWRNRYRDLDFPGTEHQEGDSYLPREITNNNGFLERISSVGPCHRYLHIPHHRLVSPHSCESRILLGHQVLVDFPFTRHRRHHCLPLYGEHHDSLPFGRLCIFLVLDHQGDIRAGRTSEKRLVSQESKTNL